VIWHGFQVHAVHVLSIGLPRISHESSMNAFWTRTIRPLSPAVFSEEFISPLSGRRNCHCYLDFGWLSVLQFVSFSLIAFLHCCRLLSFLRVLHSTLYDWEGIRLFTALLHLLRCMCGHLLFSPARLKDVGRLCHLFPLP
jgi:hypothetical protein